MNDINQSYHDAILTHSDEIKRLAHELWQHNATRCNFTNVLRNVNNNIEYHQNLKDLNNHIQDLINIEDSSNNLDSISRFYVHSHEYTKQELNEAINNNLLLKRSLYTEKRRIELLYCQINDLVQERIERADNYRRTVQDLKKKLKDLTKTTIVKKQVKSNTAGNKQTKNNAAIARSTAVSRLQAAVQRAKQNGTIASPVKANPTDTIEPSSSNSFDTKIQNFESELQGSSAVKSVSTQLKQEEEANPTRSTGKRPRSKSKSSPDNSKSIEDIDPSQSSILKENQEESQKGFESYIGRKIRKKFGKTFYYGEVKLFRRPYYLVKYEDGDSEDMTLKEVLQYAYPDDKIKKSISSDENIKAESPMTHSTTNNMKRKRSRPSNGSLDSIPDHNLVNLSMIYNGNGTTNSDLSMIDHKIDDNIFSIEKIQSNMSYIDDDKEVKTLFTPDDALCDGLWAEFADRAKDSFTPYLDERNGLDSISKNSHDHSLPVESKLPWLDHQPSLEVSDRIDLPMDNTAKESHSSDSVYNLNNLSNSELHGETTHSSEPIHDVSGEGKPDLYFYDMDMEDILM